MQRGACVATRCLCCNAVSMLQHRGVYVATRRSRLTQQRSAGAVVPRAELAPLHARVHRCRYFDYPYHKTRNSGTDNLHNGTDDRNKDYRYPETAGAAESALCRPRRPRAVAQTGHGGCTLALSGSPPEDKARHRCRARLPPWLLAGMNERATALGTLQRVYNVLRLRGAVVQRVATSAVAQQRRRGPTVCANRLLRAQA